MKTEKVMINTDYIKLEQLIKLSGFCTTSGEAKQIILKNFVLVNNVPCAMRAKKLYDKDIVEIKSGQEPHRFQVIKLVRS